MKTEKVTLDGKEYTLKPFTLDQLVEVSDTLDVANGGKIGFKAAVRILKLALATAEPPLTLDEAGKLVLTFKDVNAANEAILRLSGIDVKPADPQQADAPAA